MICEKGRETLERGRYIRAGTIQDMIGLGGIIHDMGMIHERVGDT